MPALDRRTLLATAAAAALFPGLRAGAALPAGPSHALSLYGDVKYGPDFTHFDYVNPDAPKGGAVRFGSVGTFDNLNPFILRGVSFIRVSNDIMQSGALFDSLMAGSADEPATAYGLIARAVEAAPDGLALTFTLDERARFHDGSPVTADDVVWTFQTLTTKGHPLYAVQLADVAGCERLADGRVRFAFKTATNRTLPLLVAGLPVLPRAWWEGRDFAQPTLDPLLGNGAYRVARVDAGRSMVWERVPDYWARDLPAARGTANFDRVQVDFYRDTTVMFEAFKAGLLDLREESTAADWFTRYDFPAVGRGLVRKEEVRHQVPQGMQSFVFNTRRPLFADVRVRRALGYALDFGWYNKTYFYDSYRRTRSYFENSELAARGLPGGAELALLETYRERVAPGVFGEEYAPPLYADTNALREGMRRALALLKEAGWSVKNGALASDATGQPFAFEFLCDEPRLERVILPWLKNLERLGIKGTLRTVDDAQYEIRTRDYDFDMLSVHYGASTTPGNELRAYFSAAAAATPGSPNLSGIKDPVVDELIEAVINADTRDALVTRARALDRILLQGFYCVPCWYADFYRVAYWTKFGRPAVQPAYVSMPAGAVPAWWVDAGGEAAVAQGQRELKSQ